MAAQSKLAINTALEECPLFLSLLDKLGEWKIYGKLKI